MYVALYWDFFLCYVIIKITLNLEASNLCERLFRNILCKFFKYFPLLQKDFQFSWIYIFISSINSSLSQSIYLRCHRHVTIKWFHLPNGNKRAGEDRFQRINELQLNSFCFAFVFSFDTFNWHLLNRGT